MNGSGTVRLQSVPGGGRKRKQFPLDQTLLRDRLVTAERAEMAYREPRRQNRPDHGRAPLATDHARVHPVYDAVLALIKAYDSNTAKLEGMRERGEKCKHQLSVKRRSRKQSSS